MFVFFSEITSTFLVIGETQAIRINPLCFVGPHTSSNCLSHFRIGESKAAKKDEAWLT